MHARVNLLSEEVICRAYRKYIVKTGNFAAVADLSGREDWMANHPHFGEAKHKKIKNDCECY